MELKIIDKLEILEFEVDTNSGRHWRCARVNGVWRQNTGGLPQNWRVMTETESKTLEFKFQRLFLNDKIDKILEGE